MQHINNLNKKRPLTSRNGSTLIGKRSLLNSQSNFTNNQKINIIVKCDHSEELIEKYFSNKISAVDKRNLLRTQIYNVLKMHNKTIAVNSLPFESDGTLTRNNLDLNRIDKIFSLYNMNFEEDMVIKCLYKNTDFYIPGKKNEKLRLFLQINNNQDWEVVMIDPHHLVATDNYKDYFKKSNGKRNYCFSELKKLGKYD